MAVSTIPQVALAADTSPELAATYLRCGQVTMEVFLAWQAGQFAAAAAKPAASGRVRVTISPKGYVVLNGVTAKGDGFAPNFTAATLADILDNAPTMIASVVDHVDTTIPADATIKVLNPKIGETKAQAKKDKWADDKLAAALALLPKFVNAPHPRAGKPALKHESAAQLAATVARLQAVAAKLTV